MIVQAGGVECEEESKADTDREKANERKRDVMKSRNRNDHSR